MSHLHKLALPPKLKYDFADSNKLLDEVISILEQHDVHYMADTDSCWVAIQQDKLEDVLSQSQASENSALNEIVNTIADFNNHTPTASGRMTRVRQCLAMEQDQLESDCI